MKTRQQKLQPAIDRKLFRFDDGSRSAADAFTRQANPTIKEWNELVEWVCELAAQATTPTDIEGS